ncbi:hypothetical protein [Hymenobacter norwichensis]|uniref:hypothetical protein n=1 Tax=Hymenobacter norwichensis TaxID=223903 RepID=UPI0003B39174|nr:hypothetical protein [Hymenobacter norwichensis]
MANEITEFGQIVTYGGSQLTLAGSDLASKINSLLVREGSGSGRGWRLFDSAQASFLNTKTVLNPGDVVLVNAKSVPIDFPVQTTSGGGGSDTIVLNGPSGETTTEFEETYTATSTATPTSAFSSGAGTIELYINGSWGALPASIPSGTPFGVRVQHPNSAPFSAILTLTYA